MNSQSLELEIFNNLLSSIAEEMGWVLIRAGYSPNIKERRDLSCAIFNCESEMIAQAAHIPVHLGSMSFSIQAVTKEELNDGDIFILNDPFKGGTHLPDITCVSPVFIKNKLEFFLTSRAHHADVGGDTPGSIPLSSAIHEEGIIIPPTLIYHNGALNKKLFYEIINSTRNPEEREGDFQAQISSLNIGKKRILELIDKYSFEKIKSSTEQLLKYSEKLMKSSISKIPNGVYEFTDFLDDDGAGNSEIPIKVSIQIKNNKAIVDFRGSAKKTNGCLNAPFSVTTSAVIYCFQCLAPNHIPLNSGPLKAIDIIVDEDSVLNAKYPSAVVGGNVETSQRIVDVVFGALSKAIPNKIQAASAGTMNNISIGSSKDNSNFAYYETIGGGMGARNGFEGVNGVQTHMTNTLNTPIESIERELPIMVEKYSLKHGSGGNGKFKGGDGIIREYKFLEKSTVTLLTERRSFSPWGLSGGKSGEKGKNILIKNGKTTKLPSKCSLELKAGDSVIIETPGGGGWGIPTD